MTVQQSIIQRLMKDNAEMHYALENKKRDYKNTIKNLSDSPLKRWLLHHVFNFDFDYVIDKMCDL